MPDAVCTNVYQAAYCSNMKCRKKLQAKAAQHIQFKTKIHTFITRTVSELHLKCSKNNAVNSWFTTRIIITFHQHIRITIRAYTCQCRSVKFLTEISTERPLAPRNTNPRQRGRVRTYASYARDNNTLEWYVVPTVMLFQNINVYS